MSATLRLFWIVLTACGVVTAAHGEPLQVAPKEGVLLLRNQNVLRGKISRVADHYLVALPGGEIRVRVSEVELFCRDLDEGYRRKQAALQQGSAAEHLALAEWCLRQGLLVYAAKEMFDAQAADPTHPRIALVERRLYRTARVNKIKRIDPPSPTVASRMTSAKELEQMMRRLPPAAVETFTATVQPLLLNSCSTAACHGRGGSVELRLERTGGRTISQRLTQRNLHAVLQQIDLDRPEQSPLLIKAGAPHALVKDGQTTMLEHRKYKRLAEWVRMVTTHKLPKATTVDEPSAELLQTMAAVAAPGGAGQSRRMPFSSHSQGTSSGVGGQGVRTRQRDEKTTATQLPKPRHRPGARGPGSRNTGSRNPVPKDPFDPAIFNRQYASPRR